MRSYQNISSFAKRVARAACLSVMLTCTIPVADSGCVSGQESRNDSPNSQVKATPWIENLPEVVRASILWQADHEEGNLTDWEPADCKYPGGGVLNTGGDEVIARATTKQSHSGRYAAEATISGAIRARNGNRAVRLMRWTDRPWDKGGAQFPLSAYYSTWMFLPDTYNSNKYSPWDPGDGGWWNVFQFKADDENGESQPMWALNIYHDDNTRTMHFGLYSALNKPAAVGQAKPVPLPVGRWFQVEAFYHVDAGRGGEIAIWQDGTRILSATGVRTSMTPKNANAIWGIGNYTDHIAGPNSEGSSTIYFDDCLVSTQQTSATLKPSASIKGDGITNHTSDD